MNESSPKKWKKAFIRVGFESDYSNYGPNDVKHKFWASFKA